MDLPSDIAARERRERTDDLFSLHSLRSFAAIIFYLLLAHAVRADDVITNVMSPVVSYQFYDSLEHAGTNSVIISPIASYQYFDWPGNDVLHLQSSPWVSYCYQFLTSPGAVTLHGRVTDTSGAALSGAAVSVMVGWTTVALTNTSGDGSYQFPSLGAGVYSLMAVRSGYAGTLRAVTLSAATANQDFQLGLLPAVPSLQGTNRLPNLSYTIGPEGSALRVFDGAQFQPIVAGVNVPSSNRMTIVLTHGWNSDLYAWPLTMASNLVASGITPSMANIVAWDWHGAAARLITPPEDKTPKQGEALGQALLGTFGPGYAQKVHFVGHSLGALVNAAAANYLHGDQVAQQAVSPAPWLASRTHMTLFDQAEVSRVVSARVLFDGLTLDLGSPTDVLKYAAKTLQGWKPSMPVQSGWADNYISLVGFYLPNTVNVALQKAEGYAGIEFWQAHSYPMTWYDLSIASPTDPANPLGFKRSYEYAQLPGVNLPFPPSDFQLGDAYHQTPLASDQLALESLPYQNYFQLVVPLFGNGADAIVQGVVGPIQIVGEVSAQVSDGVIQAGAWISQGFDYVGNAALQGSEAVVGSYNSAALQIHLHTTGVNTPSLGSKGILPMDAGGGGSNSVPMAWLPIQFPSNATAMAFDFTVEGNPVDDALVCGIGTNNLFSLGARYIPTNTISASSLLDVSAWAGTTNELFFGFMGGTSTNATLTIQNIRFYSLAPPRLEIVAGGSGATLSWPVSAGGYALETTTNLSAATWETVTNPPPIYGDRYLVTNSAPDATRFFRLRQR